MGRRPSSINAAVRDGAKLIELCRFEEADAVLQTALTAWPDDGDLLMQHAFSAHDSGRYQDAALRWERARQSHPDFVMPWCGIAANLREDNKLDKAVATITEALRRFPDDYGVIGEAARIFDRTGNRREAVGFWRRLLDYPPVHPDWLQGYANSLLLLGRFDEAEATLDHALGLHPDDRSLFATRGMLAMAREDWDGALAFWRAYRAAYPDDRTGWEMLGQTISAKQLARSEAGHPPPDDVLPADIATVEDSTARDLLLGFESIGADCEFGLVQRRYGAEPLGLLRWNMVSLRSLMDALAAGFEDMGGPETTALTISSSGEYYVTDLRWHLGMHTFLFETQVDGDILFPKMCRRVVYLKDKLVADLKAAEKIFVFKTNNIELDDLRSLHRLMRTFGPVRLLHVRQAGMPLSAGVPQGMPGDVLLIEPDLYVGFLGRMGNAQPQWNIAFEDWVSICKNVDRAPILAAAWSNS